MSNSDKNEPKMLKWNRPSGRPIETNDSEASIQKAAELGWTPGKGNPIKAKDD